MTTARLRELPSASLPRRPAPEPIPVVRVVEGRRKSARPALSIHPQPDALARAPDPGRNFGHRHEIEVCDPSHPEPIDRFGIGDRRGDRLVKARCLAAEVHDRDSDGGSDQRVVAAGFVEGIEHTSGSWISTPSTISVKLWSSFLYFLSSSVRAAAHGLPQISGIVARVPRRGSDKLPTGTPAGRRAVHHAPAMPGGFRYDRPPGFAGDGQRLLDVFLRVPPEPDHAPRCCVVSTVSTDISLPPTRTGF